MNENGNIHVAKRSQTTPNVTLMPFHFRILQHSGGGADSKNPPTKLLYQVRKFVFSLNGRLYLVSFQCKFYQL
jgi:hypothetical protein